MCKFFAYPCNTLQISNVETLGETNVDRPNVEMRIWKFLLKNAELTL